MDFHCPFAPTLQQNPESSIPGLFIYSEDYLAHSFAPADPSAGEVVVPDGARGDRILSRPGRDARTRHEEFRGERGGGGH